MKKVILCSGGIDSTTCLALALQDTLPEDILALNLYYGQRHDREIRSAREVARYYNIELIELNLAEIFNWSNCSLLKASTKDIPEESYADQLTKTDGHPVNTYVPFRNGLMLSVAASIAVSVGATEIWYGAHADDAAGNAYPDCSVAFTDAINKAIYEGTGGQVNVTGPFVNFTKADVVREGLRLNAPYNLTWSCYKGGEHPCGKCGTCIDRANAFKINNAVDPVK